MSYFISFLEGIITFISPCLLPMLPIYVSYFAGTKNEKRPKAAALNASGFILGFTLIFMSLGLFAGTAGRLLKEHQTAVNIVSGLLMILFGLNFMDVIKLPLINTSRKFKVNLGNLGFVSSMLFGMIFAVSWTPCVGTFLGSALLLAASGGGSAKGGLMLLCFSLGLGIPFFVSAILIDRLKAAFDFIKRHYKVINLISGGLLVLVGIMMATGMMGYFLSFLTF
ncbi:MAG TPA: cytochrome c biogenesis CcdA family protein [Candidatus Avimonas sp.]|nr:cytochrome c biogenesis CcdA family protein [Candidatus Avimonas sp.]